MTWYKDYLKRLDRSIEKGNKELDLALYLSEFGANAGIQKIWADRASWISDLLFATRKYVEGFKDEGNWIPCVENGDVWFFCSGCGYVLANASYSADYEDIGIGPSALNIDMELDFCPHCGQRQGRYHSKEEETALRQRWKNGDL